MSDSGMGNGFCVEPAEEEVSTPGEEGNRVQFFYMETISSSSPSFGPHKPSSFEEFSMQQSLVFTDSLKDLKNLRTQLYSAAEYFEVSYVNDDDQKHMVVETLKDYAIKALINTVDHLGSVAHKLNGFLDEGVDVVSGTECSLSCTEQKLRACQKYVNQQGFRQQSLEIMTPKFHKRYLLPVGSTLRNSSRPVTKHQLCSLEDEDDWHQVKNAVLSLARDTPSSRVRKGYSPSPSRRPSFGLGTFSFSEEQTIPVKRSPSPLRAKFPFIRSESFSSRPTTPQSSRPTTPLSSRPTTPLSSRPTTPNTSNTKRYLSEPGRSASMRLHAEKDSHKDIEQQPTKSKRLLKALLSRRKSKKDESLYTFLDEY